MYISAAKNEEINFYLKKISDISGSKVLPGMHEDLLVLLPELPRDRDALDKLGTCSDNGDDLQVPTSQNPVPILVAAPDTFVHKPLPDKGIRVNDIPAINNNRVFLPAEFFHLRGI